MINKRNTAPPRQPPGRPYLLGGGGGQNPLLLGGGGGLNPLGPRPNLPGPPDLGPLGPPTGIKSSSLVIIKMCAGMSLVSLHRINIRLINFICLF